MQFIPLLISVLALIVSMITLYVSQIRRGKIKMTRPTVVFFGPDSNDARSPKIYFRALLFSTGKRGVILEHLFVRIRRGETQQNFSIWVYGEEKLARGSGIFIGEAGIATNHHFLAPADIKHYEFISGIYEISVFGKLIGNEKIQTLSTFKLSIDSYEAEQLKNYNNGLFFNWGPDAGQYQKSIAQIHLRTVDSQKLLV